MTERLGWTLIHFVWQGALIAAVYAIVRSRMSRSGPDKRYVLGCVALAAMTIAPLVTLALMNPPSPVREPAHRAAHVNAASMSVYGSSLYGNTLNPAAAASPQRWMPWIVTLWLAGAILFWLRLIAGWAIASRMKSMSVRPAPPEWQRTLDDLCRSIGLLLPVRLLISALVKIPTVIGYVRPVVLVPVGALTGLPSDQIEALLIHELAHIRRHDYLVNILQGVAEALLFYHPVVWWISGHIRVDREQCCDDVAVAATGDVVTYARALASLESSRVFHFTPAIAANSGSLANRIGRLLGQSPASMRIERTGAGAVAVATAILLIVTGSAMHGQAPPRPQFEVASVKENPTFAGKTGGMVSPSPGTFRARNMTLRWLCRAAYNINSFDILGGPPWLDSAGFDIDAKTPVIPGQSKREATAEMNVMLQSVLEDRFKLKTHIETRELPVYILTIAKGGLKMKPAPCDVREPACQAQLQEVRKTWPEPVSGSWGTVADLLVGLATTTNGSRKIIDETGLTGNWDLHMQWVYHAPPNPANAGNQAETTESDEESIFTALEKQLGLKLESGKDPVEVLVIDHAEKPDPN